jgi:alkanesulfonate monooxygenase
MGRFSAARSGLKFLSGLTAAALARLLLGVRMATKSVRREAARGGSKRLMSENMPDHPLEVFSTCPMPGDADGAAYLRRVIDAARWSEEAGCKGILVYSDNSLADAWTVSHVILQNTAALCPLVAVQPVYMHPYSAAKILTTLAYFYGRRIYLNMIAGGFTGDLQALQDTTPHDRRYARLVEYTAIIKDLLAGQCVTRSGEFYRVERLKLTPAFPAGLFPGIFISGSSAAGLAAAAAVGATAIKYPKPAKEETPAAGGDCGIRVGIIAREEESAAWQAAHARFPEDRKGQLTHRLAMKASDSVWHRQLSDLQPPGGNSPYWLGPFQNYKTFCPYLVGSYRTVARELGRYVEAGYRTFVLDIPPDREELFHIRAVFERVSGREAP